MRLTIQVDVFRKVQSIPLYWSYAISTHIHFGYPTVGGAVVVVILYLLFARLLNRMFDLVGPKVNRKKNQLLTTDINCILINHGKDV